MTEKRWHNRDFKASGFFAMTYDGTEKTVVEYFSSETATARKNWHWKVVADIKNGDPLPTITVTVLHFPTGPIWIESLRLSFSKSVKSKASYGNMKFDVGVTNTLDIREPDWKVLFSTDSVELKRYSRNYKSETTGPFDFKFSVSVTYRLPKSVCCDCFPPEHLNPPPKPLKTLSADWKELLFSTNGSDVVFEVGEEKIPAHQLILTTRLAYFKKLFASNMKEAQSRIIKIEDTDSATFRELLKYIYAGEMPEDVETSPEAYLPLAEKYDLPEIKDSCSASLSRRMEQSNVIETLILSDIYRLPGLKKGCLHSLEFWKGDMSLKVLQALKPYPDLMSEVVNSIF